MRTRTSQLVLAALILVAASPRLAAIDLHPATLTASQIAEVLRASGIETRAENVEMVSAVPIAGSDVALQLLDWNRLSDSETWLRLRCKSSEQCLPFFVIVHGMPQAFAAKIARDPRRSRFALQNRSKQPTLIRAGSRAVLVLEGGRARITTTVICLDNGALRSRVRVKNPATRQILMAEVVGKGVVRSTF